MEKLCTRELIRLALICGIRDREGYAEADSGEAGQRAAEHAKQMRAMLRRRYGHDTPDREVFRGARSVSTHELRDPEDGNDRLDQS